MPRDPWGNWPHPEGTPPPPTPVAEIGAVWITWRRLVRGGWRVDYVEGFEQGAHHLHGSALTVTRPGDGTAEITLNSPGLITRFTVVADHEIQERGVRTGFRRDREQWEQSRLAEYEQFPDGRWRCHGRLFPVEKPPLGRLREV